MSYYGYNGETEYERRVRDYEWEERLDEEIDREDDDDNYEFNRLNELQDR